MRLDLREQLKFKERLGPALDEARQVLVIGEIESENILSAASTDALLEVELPVKKAGSESGHEQRKIKDLVALL